jgi:hypothetical protein
VYEDGTMPDWKGIEGDELVCPFHHDRDNRLTSMENCLNGKDGRGGLVASVEVIKDTVDTIKKAIYGLIGLICATVFLSIMRWVMK